MLLRKDLFASVSEWNGFSGRGPTTERLSSHPYSDVRRKPGLYFLSESNHLDFSS